MFRKLFEKKPLRTLIGLTLTGITFIIATAFPKTAYTGYEAPVLEIVSLSPSAIKLTTTASINYPLGSLPIKVNQGFHSWHPGIDFDGEIGDPVYPIMKGKVISTNYHRVAYGNHIIIDHGLGIQSLYAHLNKINVQTDEQVTSQSIIGEVGSTGRSTGSHLHLEIIDQEQRINPISLLDN